MHRLVSLTALAALLFALLGSSGRLLVLAKLRTANTNANANANVATHVHRPYVVPRIRPKRLRELVANQQAREAGSPREQEQIARMRQYSIANNRRGGQVYNYN